MYSKGSSQISEGLIEVKTPQWSVIGNFLSRFKFVLMSCCTIVIPVDEQEWDYEATSLLQISRGFPRIATQARVTTSAKYIKHFRYTSCFILGDVLM